MKVRVEFYGKLIDITQCQFTEAEGNSVKEILNALHMKFPLLKNETFVTVSGTKVLSPEDKISNEQTLALLPPFAGG